MVDYKNFYEVICNSDNLGLMRFDTDCNAVYMNDQLKKITERSFDDFKDMGWQNLIHPSDIGSFLIKWKNNCKVKEDFTTEIRLTNKYKEPIWVSFKVHYTDDGAIVTVKNINKKKKLIEELTKLREA